MRVVLVAVGAVRAVEGDGRTVLVLKWGLFVYFGSDGMHCVGVVVVVVVVLAFRHCGASVVEAMKTVRLDMYAYVGIANPSALPRLLVLRCSPTVVLAFCLPCAVCLCAFARSTFIVSSFTPLYLSDVCLCVIRVFQESVAGLAAALEVAERACSPFLRWRPEAHFFRAELLERMGKTDEARKVYKRVLSEVRCRELSEV